MSPRESHEQAIKDFLGLEDYRVLWKSLKEDLYSKIVTKG